jgi:hypothetical protein
LTPEEESVSRHYGITVDRILSSPAHNYFTRPRFTPGRAPALEHEAILLQPGRGIAGDRFEHSRYPLTFFSREVADLVAKARGRSVDTALFRRNIIVSGINLCELIGERFRIGGVLFEGIGHCAPCPWMDAVIGKGTYTLMKGRGGLRARILGGGRLRCGENVLTCEKQLTREPAEPVLTRRLP